MKLIDLNCAIVKVSNKAEVAPVGEKFSLGTNEPGTTYYQSSFLIDSLCDLCLTIVRVVNWRPGVLIDPLYLSLLSL